MARKPRIAMTTWRRTMPTFLNDRTDLYTLGAEYPQSVLAAGGLPVLLPLHDAADAARVLEGFDGVVIVGGGDVDPTQYGQHNTGLSEGTSLDADASDLGFVRAANELDLPLFAICRGCQVLNVAMGGSLHQDVTEAGGVHPPISDVPTEVLALRHPITIATGSRLAKAYGGATEWVVNSIHHQGLDVVAPGFHAVAWASDGLIEAIEPDDPGRSVLAVQWHPEKITDEGDRALFDHFVHEMVGS
ncbi:gamma-glutamyl-gamma-aminobutyrate hydrolase family protein [soil metagenome]